MYLDFSMFTHVRTHESTYMYTHRWTKSTHTQLLTSIYINTCKRTQTHAQEYAHTTDVYEDNFFINLHIHTAINPIINSSLTAISFPSSSFPHSSNSPLLPASSSLPVYHQIYIFTHQFISQSI